MKTPYCLGMIRLNTFFKARIIQHFCPKYKKKVRYIKKERRKRTAFLIRSMELCDEIVGDDQKRSAADEVEHRLSGAPSAAKRDPQDEKGNCAEAEDQRGKR